MAPQPACQPEQDALWHLNITEDQQALLDTLREELSARAALVPSLDDDLSLLRFLKARHWDLRKATDMYQNMANWRRVQGIEETLQTFKFPERAAVRCVYPHFYHKTDRYGRPVYYERTGRVDFERLMSVTTHERFLTYHISLAETFRQHKLAACSAIVGRPVLGLVVVLDLEGFSLREFAAARELLTEMTRIDQSYFPEHLGAMFIINAPVLFRSAWACVKPFLDPRTLGKIKVLGSNYRPELLALIPEENLPVRFGGASAANEMEDEGPWSDWTGLPSGLPVSPRCGSPMAMAQPLARLPSAALSGELLETGSALAATLPCSAAAGAASAAVVVSAGAMAAADDEAPLSLVAISSRRSSRTSSRGSSPGLGLLITPQQPQGTASAGPFTGSEVGAESSAAVARQPRASLLGETIQEEPLGGERAGSGSSEGTVRVASLLESWPAAAAGAAAAGGAAAGAHAAGALRRRSSAGGQLLSPTASGALAGALAGKLAIGDRVSAASGEGALLSPRSNA